jgi:hypothetical protein
MTVNKYQVRLSSGENYINFPLISTNSNIGQEDVVNNDFVEVEVEKSINPIVDIDKKRFVPRNGDTDITRVNYKVNTLSDGAFPDSTSYSDEGFVNEDIIYQRNSFKRSFLNLLFFDSDEPTQQNYLGNIVLNSRLSRFDLKGVKSIEAPVESGGSTSNKDEVIEATYDEGIGDAHLIGHVCTSIYFPQKIEYFYSGVKWKRKTTTSWGEQVDGCDNPNMMMGEEVSNRPNNLPAGFFSKVMLLESNYNISGKSGTYSIYAVWERNFNTNMYYLENVYFIRNISETSTSSETTGRTARNISSREQREYDTTGIPNDVSEIPIQFILEDPVVYPAGRAEGFYVYHDEYPASIYMRANWNNAKTGFSTDLVTSEVVLDIDKVLSKLHMKYDLKKSGDTYYYEIDSEYSDNIEYTADEVLINLYEIQVR